MAPPKAAEFRRIARAELKPVLARLDLQPQPSVGLGGWTRAEPDGWLVFWLQLSHWNSGFAPDEFEFTAELQLGDDPVAGLGGPRRRLFDLLTTSEREDHRQIQNLVIAKTHLDQTWLDGLSPGDRAIVLARYMPRFVPYDSRRDQDVWFRYVDVEDVRRWMKFIETVLPGVVSRFLAGARAGA
jgi:hypothetical protein